MNLKTYNKFFLLGVLFALLIGPASVWAEADGSIKGDDITPRIVGGFKAPPGAWPWATAIIFAGSNPPSSGQFCGASYIGSNWAVTAAHCVEYSLPSSIEAVIGRQDLLNGSDGDRLNVSEIIIHPSFNPFTFDNDIALLKLSSTSGQTPINLIDDLLAASVVTGTDTTVIGWGALSEGGATSSDLQQVVVPVYDQNACDDAYGDISDNMICAGLPSGGKDSCQGDSGGPLMFESSGVWYLTGLVSFGTGCARPNLPGVYTRVSEFLSWIEVNTGIGSSQCPQDIEAHSAPSIPAGDDDLDGISSSEETAAGTNPNDRGSYPVVVQDFGAGFWSGFLNVSNILELINNSASNSNVSLKLYTIDGTPCSETTFVLSPGEQRDIILNDLGGFLIDSYGLVTVSASGGSIDGRVSYYRAREFRTSGEYDFAYSLPLYRANFGDTVVGFNTFQASNNPADATKLVPNWLSVINLSSSSKSFNIATYDSSGSLELTKTVGVPPRGRIDLDGGHDTLGPDRAGSHVISPADNSAPYLAFLTRYGNNKPAGESPSGFEFASVLFALAGNGEPMLAPLTTTLKAQNWLEVTNTRAVPTAVTIDFRRDSGELASQSSLTLQAHEQRHINVNTILGDNKLGFARIIPGAINSIVAQSMVYLRDTDGSILSVYASQAREAFSLENSGTYNLFLSMQNWLKFANSNDQIADVVLTLKHPGGTSNQFNFSVPANSSIDLGLHDFTSFGTLANTYGIIDVSSNRRLGLELLRLRNGASSSRVDFAFPTVVR